MDRVDRLMKQIENENIDAVMIINFENSSKASSFYFSDFTGSFSILILHKNFRKLITDPRYTEQAKKETDFEIIEYREGEIFDFLKKILDKLSLKKLGIEERRISLYVYNQLKEKLNLEFVPVDKYITFLRMSKDDEEIRRIREAVVLAENAFKQTIEILKPGMTEKEVAAYLEYRMKVLGAESPAFETIVASGWRSALPHGKASDKKIEKNEPIVFDFGAKLNGYSSDITRMVCIGEPDDDFKEIHSIVFEAQNKSLEEARAGITGKDLDSVARDFISSKGYGHMFGHGLGHGLGIEVHEEPRISPRNEEKLPENSVITIEPGIYLENRFGVRIEEDVVLKKDGREIITSLPREIIVV